MYALPQRLRHAGVPPGQRRSRLRPHRHCGVKAVLGERKSVRFGAIRKPGSIVKPGCFRTRSSLSGLQRARSRGCVRTITQSEIGVFLSEPFADYHVGRSPRGKENDTRAETRTTCPRPYSTRTPWMRWECGSPDPCAHACSQGVPQIRLQNIGTLITAHQRILQRVLLYECMHLMHSGFLGESSCQAGSTCAHTHAGTLGDHRVFDLGRSLRCCACHRACRPSARGRPLEKLLLSSSACVSASRTLGRSPRSGIGLIYVGARLRLWSGCLESRGDGEP